MNNEEFIWRENSDDDTLSEPSIGTISNESLSNESSLGEALLPTTAKPSTESKEKEFADMALMYHNEQLTKKTISDESNLVVANVTFPSPKKPVHTSSLQLKKNVSAAQPKPPSSEKLVGEQKTAEKEISNGKTISNGKAIDSVVTIKSILRRKDGKLDQYARNRSNGSAVCWKTYYYSTKVKRVRFNNENQYFYFQKVDEYAEGKDVKEDVAVREHFNAIDDKDKTKKSFDKTTVRIVNGIIQREGTILTAGTCDLQGAPLNEKQKAASNRLEIYCDKQVVRRAFLDLYYDFNAPTPLFNAIKELLDAKEERDWSLDVPVVERFLTARHEFYSKEINTCHEKIKNYYAIILANTARLVIVQDVTAFSIRDGDFERFELEWLSNIFNDIPLLQDDQKRKNFDKVDTTTLEKEDKTGNAASLIDKKLQNRNNTINGVAPVDVDKKLVSVDRTANSRPNSKRLDIRIPSDILPTASTADSKNDSHGSTSKK